MRILIAEEGQHVIAAVRLMRKMGHEIYLVTSRNDRVSRSVRSRRIQRTFTIPDPENDVEWIRSIKEIYEWEKIDVFFPFGYKIVTAYIDTVNSNSDLHMRTPYSGYDAYWNLSDKHRLYDLCSRIDIKMPRLYGEAQKGGIPSDEEFSYPVIVKVTRGKGILGNVILARAVEEIVGFIEHSHDENRYIIQQYIPGDVFDVGGFSVNGTVVYNVPQRRTVTLPLRGGVAAVNDVYPDDGLLRMSASIMEKAGWTGPFQSEFRIDPKSGKYFLIEVNAKMWGSTQLSLRSNPDLIQMALDTAVGKSVNSNLKYRSNLRQRWLSLEISALRFGSFTDHIGFVRRFFKASGYDFCISDPLPDIHRYYSSVKTAIIRPGDLPKPLIDRKTHMKLNQIL